MEVGVKGVDFAYAPATASKMVADGASFFCRYSAGEGGASNGKTCRVGEIGSYVKLGADFFANFELNESTPTEGAPSGKKHGAADNDFWAARGLAPHAGIIASWEPGTDTSQYTNVGNFLAAYKAATGRPVGLYAGLPTLKHFRSLGLIDLTWMPMSSSASGIDTSNLNQAQYAAKMQQVATDNGINLCQNRNRWYGVGADEDVYTTATEIPFSHLDALGAGMALAKSDLADIKSVAVDPYMIGDDGKVHQVRTLVTSVFQKYFVGKDKKSHTLETLVAEATASQFSSIAELINNLGTRVAAIQASLVNSGTVAVNVSTVPVTGTLTIGGVK